MSKPPWDVPLHAVARASRRRGATPTAVVCDAPESAHSFWLRQPARIVARPLASRATAREACRTRTASCCHALLDDLGRLAVHARKRTSVADARRSTCAARVASCAKGNPRSSSGGKLRLHRRHGRTQHRHGRWLRRRSHALSILFIPLSFNDAPPASRIGDLT
jgi:hypothetical protein